jgi:hypothetical protein
MKLSVVKGLGRGVDVGHRKLSATLSKLKLNHSVFFDPKRMDIDLRAQPPNRVNILRAIAQTTCPISLENAIRAGNVEHVWLALELGVDDALCMGACEDTEIVRMLLEPERGVDPAARDNYALTLAACVSGHTDIVRLLLELPLDRGVDPAARNNYALRCRTTDL